MTVFAILLKIIDTRKNVVDQMISICAEISVSFNVRNSGEERSHTDLDSTLHRS